MNNTSKLKQINDDCNVNIKDNTKLNQFLKIISLEKMLQEMVTVACVCCIQWFKEN